jgi:phosphatidylserine/phosphatidylglycerophosphate/cardiolipin synthase-like enzyme
MTDRQKAPTPAAASPAAAPAPASEAPFTWEDLTRYKQAKRLLDGYPSDIRTFFSPTDEVHEALKALLATAQHSIVLNMYGYDDAELDDIIRAKLASDHVYVQMSLDKTQAAGAHEHALLKEWEDDQLGKWEHGEYGNSIAIGHSTRGAISHMKIVIIDGVYTIRGSTNWSLAGEQKQDNELTIHRNAVVAAETRAQLDRNHDAMLKQMAEARSAGRKVARVGAGAEKRRAVSSPRPGARAASAAKGAAK